MSAPLGAVRSALAGERAWLVGGAVRDRLLGRPVDDLDVVLTGDPREAARAVKAAAGGAMFALSEQFGAWRVVGEGQAWHVDLLPLREVDLPADLSARDLTINAIAEDLAGGEIVDPFGGRRDLADGVLRMVGPSSVSADPLRVARLARLGAELRFEIDDATLSAAREVAGGLSGVAAERVFMELRRVIAAASCVEGMRLLDDVGALAVVLPELHALKGVEQNVFHHLDVWEHTLAVLASVVELEADPSPLGESATTVAAALAEPLADELTRWQAMRVAALLHDVAKPDTQDVLPDGRVTFFHHDAHGAETARAVLRRLRASQRLADHVAALTLHHLRLGFLVHSQPLSRRELHRYLVRTAPVTVDVTVLTVADRLATRGRGAEAAIAKHLALASSVLPVALTWVPEKPLVRGDELARELGLAGPEIAAMLAELAEAQFAGEITTRDEALTLARAAR